MTKQATKSMLVRWDDLCYYLHLPSFLFEYWRALNTSTELIA